MYVAIDLETTGRDPLTCDVVEIGAAIYFEGGQLADSRRWDIDFNPNKMEDGALALHGIYYVADSAVSMRDAIRDLMSWVGDWTKGKKATIIGHNFPQFDLPIIMRSVNKDEWDEYFLYRIADTSATGLMLKAAGVLTDESLSGQCEFFGIENLQAHRALSDAKAEAALFFKQRDLIKRDATPASKVFYDDGLEALNSVLQEALAQVSSGKGEERHGNGMGFFDQPWVSLARTHGNGFLTGQATKKLMESVGLPTEERRTRERLGVIVYTAMSILHDKGVV